ncbi:unnamed protein product [Rotaria socialis]
MDDTLYILGGKLTYEFIRLNIVGALPSLTTLYGIISDTNLKIIEGQFRFDELKHHSDLLNTKFGFVSEDCTGVVQKITYNERTNSFVGFSAPLTNGIPYVNHFQTDSFEQLKTWFSTVNKASLLNVHMFQPIPSNHLKSSSPFVLAAYGVNNQCTSIDILKRWSYIYDECCKKQIRVIGFSTDADAKYLSAMRLTSGFFANLTNIKLHENDDAFKINIPPHWTWFFLRSQQLFLFFQDATHVATKWRNRLLASTAHLVLGQQPITMQHLQNIIDNGYNKLDHGLVYIDDVFMTWNKSENELKKIIENANTWHPNIKLEYKISKSLPFLDVLLTNINGTLSASVYHKPAAEPYVVPFISDHPRHVFENIVQTSRRRAVKYSSTFQLFNDERRYIKSTFLYNGYPSSFIDKTFRKFFSDYISSRSFLPFLHNEAQFIQMRIALSGQPSRQQSEVEMRIATLTTDNEHLIEESDKKSKKSPFKRIRNQTNFKINL